MSGDLRVQVIIFCSIQFFFLKSNQTKIINFFLKKTKVVQTGQFRFGFLGQKRFKSHISPSRMSGDLRVHVIIFCSIQFLSKKVTKPKLLIFSKKNETGLNRPISVRFFRTKTVSNCFGSVLFILT